MYVFNATVGKDAPLLPVILDSTKGKEKEAGCRSSQMTCATVGLERANSFNHRTKREIAHPLALYDQIQI